ncbi:MAG: hypothetical protein ACRCUY_03700 [Thermoguttaceae bacterium]
MRMLFCGTIILVFLCTPLFSVLFAAEEPLALDNPLTGRRQADVREDTMPGYIEMSNGEVFPGLLYITRDKRLEIYDAEIKRQRTIPITKISEIECQVEQEWMEKEWRFKELASDEKMYTGRTYPCRRFVHKLTFDDGRILEGTMSGIIFVQSLQEGETTETGHIPEREAERFYFNKRQSEPSNAGKKLSEIHYTARVKIGDDALAEGIRKAAAFGKKKNPPTPPAKIRELAPGEKKARL